MDFKDTPEEAKFRAKCRAWLEENAELKSAETNSTEKMNVGNESVLEKIRSELLEQYYARGKYAVKFIKISASESSDKNSIIKEYAKQLENQIIQNPGDWLWSHKRWKLTK